MDEGKIIQALDLAGARATLLAQPNSPLAQMLQAILQDIIDKLQKSLIDRNINTARRELSQSILPTQVALEGSTLKIGLSMAYYWKFINYGVNGTEVGRGAPAWGSSDNGGKTFKDSILEWIPARGVQLPPQFKTYDSFAWAIMTNIRKRGQEARPFYSDVINDNTANFIRGPIERLLRRSIEIAIVSPWQ